MLSKFLQKEKIVFVLFRWEIEALKVYKDQCMWCHMVKTNYMCEEKEREVRKTNREKNVS